MTDEYWAVSESGAAMHRLRGFGPGSITLCGLRRERWLLVDYADGDPCQTCEEMLEHDEPEF